MKAVASSIVRLTKKGADHGFLYYIDLSTGIAEQVLKWNDDNINWEGRGGDRGLRGIVLYNDSIIVGSGKQIIFLDKQFNVNKTFTHPLLGDIHELWLDNNDLIITSTLYDLILFLDLINMRLKQGYWIKPRFSTVRKQDIFHKKAVAFRKKILYRWIYKKVMDENFLFEVINPETFSAAETKISQSIHINTTFFHKNILCFTGTQSNCIFGIENNKLIKKGIIPFGTHNVTPLNDNVLLMNHTLDHHILQSSWNGKKRKIYSVVYNSDNLKGNFDPSLAQPGWCRGLNVMGEYFIAGCSPATINLYKIGIKKPLQSIQLDNDVRNSIHGLKFIPEGWI